MSDAEFLDIVDNFLLSGYNSPSPSNDKDSTVPFGWFIDVPVESESLGISSTSGTLNGSAPGFKVRVPASEREPATSLDRDNPTVWVVDLIGPSSISQPEAAPLDLDSEAHDFEYVLLLNCCIANLYEHTSLGLSTMTTLFKFIVRNLLIRTANTLRTRQHWHYQTNLCRTPHPPHSGWHPT